MYVHTHIYIYIHAPGPATPPPPHGMDPIYWPHMRSSPSPPVVWWGCGTVPLFLFRPNTYAGKCMSIEHIYMRTQGSRGI